jgi:hypothetical protein
MALSGPRKFISSQWLSYLRLDARMITCRKINFLKSLRLDTRLGDPSRVAPQDQVLYLTPVLQVMYTMDIAQFQMIRLIRSSEHSPIERSGLFAAKL